MRVQVEGETRIPVRFRYSIPPYNVGEQAGFREEFALELVRRGYAVLVDNADAADLQPAAAPGWSDREKEMLREGELLASITEGDPRGVAFRQWLDATFPYGGRVRRAIERGR